MGVLDRFEKRLDRIVNGAFARTFKAEVEPVEVAAALQRECDDRAAIVDRGRRVVPNVFTVELGPHDYERLSPYAEPLDAEFSSMVREHAEEAGYVFFGPGRGLARGGQRPDTGLFRIRSDVHSPPVPAWCTPGDARRPRRTSYAPVSDPQRVRRHRARRPTVPARQGRRRRSGAAPDCDIQIDDPGISRAHARIDLAAPPVVVDLGSTNGTWVDGRRVQAGDTPRRRRTGARVDELRRPARVGAAPGVRPLAAPGQDRAISSCSGSSSSGRGGHAT